MRIVHNNPVNPINLIYTFLSFICQQHWRNVFVYILYTFNKNIKQQKFQPFKHDVKANEAHHNEGALELRCNALHM